MKARVILYILLIFVLALLPSSANSQVPMGFSYQAVIRDGNGAPIANRNVSLQVTLQRASGTVYYTERKNLESSALGVVSYNVGSGTVMYGLFDTIPWHHGDFYIKVEIDPEGGANYTQMGSATQLQSVPYSLYTKAIKEVTSLPNDSDEEPIFVVRNKAGKIVFAVYQTGVRVYVEDTGVKGVRGGFAVGGLTNQKQNGPEYFRITPDSARINVNEVSSVIKGMRGGFAVGGLTNQKTTQRDLLYIAPDSARIYVDDSSTPKGMRGGFAVGGLTNQKASSSQFLDLNPDNYFIGKDAGKSISTGKYNSFIGYQSGYSNSTGGYNIFLGYHAGYTNNSNYNIFMGYESGKTNSIGGNNTFIGYQAGYNHLRNDHNVFLGNSSGYYDSCGYYNVFLGYKAGYSNKKGYFNVIIGNDAGGSATNHRICVYIGNNAGKYRTDDGFANVFIGNIAGEYGDGDYNVFVGGDAGSTVSGNNNTGMGQSAGKGTTGSNNLFLGYAAGYLLGSVSNRVVLGNSSISSLVCYGPYAETTASAANLYVSSSGHIMRNSSSKRYKKDITDLNINTSLIYKLHPVSFISISENTPHFGLIAEEVADVIPELAEFAVEKQVVPGSTSEKLIPDAVQYPLLSVLLLNEVQKHEQKIVTLTSKIEELNAENTLLKTQLKELNSIKANLEILKNELNEIKAMLK